MAAKRNAVDDQTKKKIILRWRKSKLNSISLIAQQYGLSESVVNLIIDKYLETKKTKN